MQTPVKHFRSPESLTAYLASVEERRADAREQTSDEKKLNPRRKPLVTVAQGSRQDRLTCPYIGKAETCQLETCSCSGHDAAKAGQPHEPGRPCYLEPPTGLDSSGGVDANSSRALPD